MSPAYFLFLNLLYFDFGLGGHRPCTFLVVHTSTPLIVFINYYLRGEPYKTTVLLISPFKGTLFLFFFCVLQKETRTRSIKSLFNLHILWTSMLLVATITDGQAILLVRPPTVPHSTFTFVVTC